MKRGSVLSESTTTEVELSPLDSPSISAATQRILHENNNNNEYPIHDISAVVKSLKDSTHFFQELLTVLNSPPGEEEFIQFIDKFNRHFENVRDELYVALNGLADTVRIQLKIHQARQRMIDLCFETIYDHYKEFRPDVVNILKTMRKLHEDINDDPSEVVNNDADDWFDSSRPRKRSRSIDQGNPMAASIKRFFSSDYWTRIRVTNFLTQKIPIINVVRKYSLHNLRGDIVAALTVAAVLVPQSLGYATLAGLQPVVGLYAAFMPCLIYGLLGSSSELSVGPVAMVSLITPSTLSSLANPKTQIDLYWSYAIFLSLFAGIILLAVGVLRLTFVIENVLSVPLLSSWLQAAAGLIVVSQLKGFLKITIASNDKSLIDYATDITNNAHQLHGWTVMLGLFSLAVLLVHKYLCRKYKSLQFVPVTIILLIITTGIIYGTDANVKRGIAIVGNIPQGLPVPQKITVTSELISKTASGAGIIALVGFIEAIGIAKRFAAIKRYQIYVEQELIALGMSNIMGGIFKSYPVTGSISRSSINFHAGSRTQLTNVFLFILVMFVLLFLTPVLQYIPSAVLSAIVIAAAITPINPRDFYVLYKQGEYVDLVLSLIVLIMTLLLGPDSGALIAVIISLVIVLYRSSRPHVARVGRLPGTLVYKDIDRFPDCITSPGVLIVRFDGMLSFFSASRLRSKLDKWENTSTPQIHTIVIDAVGLNNIDSSGQHQLREMLDTYEKKEILVLFSEVKGVVRDALQRTGLDKKVGLENFFLDTHDAIEFVAGRRKTLEAAQSNGDVKDKDKDKDKPKKEKQNEHIEHIALKINGAETSRSHLVPNETNQDA